MLPKVVPSSGEIGIIYKGMLFQNDNQEIPITAAIGYQQAVLFGQLCLTTGEIKNTYGTGWFILMNIGHTPLLSKQGLPNYCCLSIKRWRAYFCFRRFSFYCRTELLFNFCMINYECYIILMKVYDIHKLLSQKKNNGFM